MSDLPMMPWWPKDWIASTRAWTVVERGLYLELLFWQWINGPLPTDQSELARLAGATPDEFESAWPRVQTKFRLIDGRLVNGKLEEHRELAVAYTEKKRAAGRAGGLASAKKRAEQTSNGRSTDADSDRQANVKHPSPSPSPIRTTTAVSAKTARPKAWPKGWMEGHEHSFEEFKKCYPKRGGDQPWHKARHAINARLKEGHLWTEIIEGAKRYSVFCKETGKTNTELVKHAATFCGPSKPFLEEWEIPLRPMSLEQANRICLRERKSRSPTESDDEFIDRMRKYA